MKKEFAYELEKEILNCEAIMSRPDRRTNYDQSVFKKETVIPLSETTALVIFSKSPSGKKAIAFFYLNVRWNWFFPTDSHILGMMELNKYKVDIESLNYPQNFNEDQRLRENLDPEQKRFADQALNQSKKDDDEVPF